MNKQQKSNHWKTLFEQQQGSGLSIIQFCRDNNVNTSTFYAWRKRLSAETALVKPQQVIPLIINEQAFAQSSRIKIITPKGYQVEFDSTLSQQVLAPLLKVL